MHVCSLIDASALLRLYIYAPCACITGLAGARALDDSDGAHRRAWRGCDGGDRRRRAGLRKVLWLVRVRGLLASASVGQDFQVEE